MNLKYIKYIVFAFAISLVGCTDWLDTTPKDRVSDKIAWESYESISLYLNGFYPYIDRYGNFGSDQFKGNLTEGLTETLKYGSYVPGSKAGDANMYVFTPESMSPTGNLLDTWTPTYERIRRVNEFLVGLGKHSQLNEDENNLVEGQALFFRAFLYFQLAKRHDGVILYTNMDLQKDKARATAAETWDLIEEDLDRAAELLPVEWDAANTGRITKGAVLAMKSRAMLYAERWESAKKAATAVIGLTQYGLEDSYAEATAGNNPESILEYNYLIQGPNHTFDKDYSTFGEIENQGASGTPTQEMVESYEHKDGGFVDWSAWHVEGGTTATPPYQDLDPRFKATVIYNGSTWMGNVMENSVDGTYGRYMGYRDETYAQGRTTTGYYLRKFRDESNTDLVTYRSTQTWVEIRLAEVYLNRAEANYHLNKSGEAVADLNVVRTRNGFGLPELPSTSGKELFNAIRQERKIELAYEGHLYWDMRRWKLAHIEYDNYRVHGLKITASGSGYNFEYVDCDLEDRTFLKKSYVLPVPYNELANNSAIEQYDEWK